MKLLIVGRTATGKDTLREALEKHANMTFVKSYATRPKRFENEDTHIFITKDEQKEIEKNDVVIAKTTIADNDYFATKSQVEKADGYIIDPIGIYALLKNMPDTKFLILYLIPNKNHRDIYIGRELSKSEKSKSDIIKEFETRTSSEDKIFNEFDSKIKTLMAENKNILGIKQLNFISEPKTVITKVEELFFAELVTDMMKIYE